MTKFTFKNIIKNLKKKKTGNESSAIFKLMINRNFKFLYLKSCRVKSLYFANFLFMREKTKINSNSGENLIKTHPTYVMISTDGRAR